MSLAIADNRLLPALLPPFSIAAGASTFTWTNALGVRVLIVLSGGIVTAISITRLGISPSLGLTSGSYILDPGDQLDHESELSVGDRLVILDELPDLAINFVELVDAIDFLVRVAVCAVQAHRQLGNAAFIHHVERLAREQQGIRRDDDVTFRQGRSDHPQKFLPFLMDEYFAKSDQIDPFQISMIDPSGVFFEILDRHISLRPINAQGFRAV